MFDIAGFCPVAAGSCSALDLEAAWEGYDRILGFEYSKELYAAAGFQFCGLSRAGEAVNWAADEECFVAVYGICYSRLEAAGIEPGQRLTAGRLYALYQSQRLDFLGQLKGEFVLIIADHRRGETYFIADPLNVKSVYYYNAPAGLLFSSSLYGLSRLMKASGIEPVWDGASFIEYYLFDFILGDETGLKDVRELQAGKMLKVSGGVGQASAYCNPFELFALTSQPLSEQQSARLLSDILRRNIALFSDGPEHTAFALTGGYDSRSIAALAGSGFQDYQYYSYGHPESWDIKVPKLLARKNNLSHLSIDLSSDFKRDYSKYALQAIRLGDGIAEASRANYPFVYANHLQDKQSIITGLFGSELIKNPSTRGAFIDENILSVLRAEDTEARLHQLYGQMLEEGAVSPAFGEAHRATVVQRMLNNPFVNNALEMNQKLFYFVLMVGVRKYFAKEIKLERFFIHNRPPFFDVDFIEALLRTPFPWVYNWTQEKSLVKNLKIHRIYANFISHNRALLDTISTHGFKPRYLRSKWLYPMLAYQFWSMKKKITQESQLSFDGELKSLFAQHRQAETAGFPFESSWMEGLEQRDFKNYVKINSLNLWMAFLTQQMQADKPKVHE
jgi:asparagine synthetase B (glutamine-hydrolysing)